MDPTAAQKYASLERLAPTVCSTLAIVLPICAYLHRPDIAFILSSMGSGILFFLGWQATLRGMHLGLAFALFLAAAVLAFTEVAQPLMQLASSLFYLQGLGSPAFSFFLCVWIAKRLSRGNNAT